jgi:hypothetical protein
MKSIWCWFWLVFLLVLVCGSCAFAFEGDVFQVVGFSPGEGATVSEYLEEVRFSFSQPVVSSEKVGKPFPVSEAPFYISPSLAGECVFEDPKTLVFKTSETLRSATLYTFSFRPDFTDLAGRFLSGSSSFHIRTAPLKVLDVRQVDYQRDGSIVLEAEFSLPVSPQRLRGFLIVKNSKGQEIPVHIPLGPPSKKILIYTAPLEEPLFYLEIAEGLTSEVGPLGLAGSFRKEMQAFYAMEITGSGAYFRGAQQGVIYFYTSTPPDADALSAFVELEPEYPFSVRAYFWGFEITGEFKPRDRVLVRLKKGLPARSGAVLAQEFKKAFLMPDLEPSISIPASGSYASYFEEARLPVELVNVSRVYLRIFRLYDNNIPFAFAFPDNIAFQDLSRLVVEREVVVDAPFNVPVRRAVDVLSEVSGKAGTYLVVIQSAEGDPWVRDQAVVSLTDIGVVSKVFEHGVLVWANSLHDALPCGGAKVKVFSRSNQLLAEGVTDDRGVFLFEKDRAWPANDERPFLITVQKGEDVSFLVLEEERFSQGDFEIGGVPYLRRGYRAFLFLPRGIFRPGEKVLAKALLRGPEFKVPERFPIAFKVVSPLGRTFFETTTMLSEEGSAIFEFELPQEALTGNYQLLCYLPGQGEEGFLGEASFLVEDFVPPRLRLNLSTPLRELHAGEEFSLEVFGEYLFGAPAAHMPVKVSARFSTKEFKHPDWGQFTFGDSRRDFAPVEITLGEYQLDSQGKTTIAFNAPSNLRPPSTLELTLLVTLLDPQGRPVSKRLSLPFHPYPFYLGIFYPSMQYEPGQEVPFTICAVDPQGIPFPLSSALVRIFKVFHHYVLVEEETGVRYRMQEEFALEKEAPVELVSGRGEMVFRPREFGRYLFEVRDPGTGVVSSTYFDVYGRYGFNPREELLERITLSLDREKWQVGEEARVSYHSPFPGKALFTVETDRVVYSRVFEAQLEGEVRFPVSAEMAPNAYCSLLVVRAHSGEDPLAPVRALGITPFYVDQTAHHLKVEIAALSSVKPMEKLPVEVTLKNAKGDAVPGEFLVALVDVGLLDLTAHQLVDPFDFFSARCKLSVGTFDWYGNLLLSEPLTTPPLYPGGGEELEREMGLALSPIQPAQFRIVSLVKPQVFTDSQGKGKVIFELPQFEGRLLLAVVASSGELLGMATQEVNVAHDVVCELVHPRFVAPGDRFSIPLVLFNRSGEKRKVEVTISESGPVTLTSEHTLSLELPPQSRTARNISMQAYGSAGEALLQVMLNDAGESRREEYRFPVRPPYPRVTRVIMGRVLPGEKKTLSLPGEWYLQTLEGKLWLQASNSLDLNYLANFLHGYPYGCVEQVVSSSWPLLYLPEIMAEVDPLLANPQEVNRSLEKAIRRVISMQTPDGGFARFAGEYVSVPFDSAYATHFLLEAKKKGFSIPEDVLRGALNYLREFLDSLPWSATPEALSYHNTASAYATLVLTMWGEPPLARMEELRNKRGELSGTALLFLSWAYALTGNSRMARELSGGFAPSLYGAPESGGAYSSYLRDLALRLLVELSIDPESLSVEQLATQLFDTLRKREYWSTQEAAFSLLALSSYLKGKVTPEAFTARVFDAQNDELFLLQREKKASWSFKELPPPPWSVANEGEGPFYFAMTVSGVPRTMPQEESQGLSVAREFLDEQGNPLPANYSFRKGDLVKVRLRLESAGTMENVVLLDLLPGCFEVENPRLFVSSTWQEEEPQVRVERRDDRVILFVEHLSGKLDYTYTARVVTAGDFVIPPVHAECMYNPSIFATSGGGQRVVVVSE